LSAIPLLPGCSGNPLALLPGGFCFGLQPDGLPAVSDPLTPASAREGAQQRKTGVSKQVVDQWVSREHRAIHGALIRPGFLSALTWS
jgi:hypothetical protein